MSVVLDDAALSRLAKDGCLVLRAVFTAGQIQQLREAFLSVMMVSNPTESVRRNAGTVYAARNVLDMVPLARTIWRCPRLTDLLVRVLGSQAGLVRGLFFDKPPERTWALPWHKDLSIAVQPGPPQSSLFSTARLKAGVPHCEAPEAVLNRMLTLRIHLDNATEANGPLEVLPGSHLTGKSLAFGALKPVKILAEAGDVLVMRPLLAHCSGLSQPETTTHRRVLHLEFSAQSELPDGHAWYQYFPVTGTVEET